MRLRLLVIGVSSILLLPSLVLISSSAHAVPGDELWDTTWNRPGTDDAVEVAVEFNGQLVIGGRFQFVGDVVANRVAIYDGVNWAPLGIGFDSDVYSLAVYNNELYAGGFFNLSDGTPVGGLAKWTGTQWVSVDGGTDGSVEDMVVHNGELVIVGSFTEVGSGILAGSIAGWNGSTWNTFNGGVSDGTPYAAASYNGQLYVTGEFEDIGFAFVANIARWNGASWSGSFGGLLDEFGEVFEAGGENIHVHDGKLIVTGFFVEAGGQALENFATYDGFSWGTIGPDPSFFSRGAFTIGDYAGDLYVYDGNFATYVWNGIFWSAEIFSGAVFDIATWGTNLVIGGIFASVNGVQAENIASSSNGSSWSALAMGNGASAGIRSFQEWNGQLVVGGTGSRFGPLVGSLVAAWDGTQWNQLGTGIPPGVLGSVDVMAVYQGDLIAAGNFSMAGGVPANRIARFDGTNWSAMGGGSPNSSVFAMTVFNNELYAGINVSGNNIARWDGSAWQPVGGTTNNIIWALGEYNGQLVVGGSFITIDGSSITGLATWNGTNWVELGGSALNGSVYGMTVQDGKLYIAGIFTSVAGSPANRVAVWDGVSWSAVGDGVNSRIFAITGFGGDIFVTGEFTASGANPLNYVSRWDGSAWDPMGSGLDDEGRAFGSYGGKLFVGGDFLQAGGTAAAGLSSWSMNQTSVRLPTLGNEHLHLRAVPNPFRSRTTIAVELTRPGDVHFSVHDVRGRLVSRRVLTGLAAGPHTMSWDGLDARGRPVAAGTYFMTARDDDGASNARVTVLR